MMTIEYIIDPKRSESFLELMQESRRSRLRHGALRWELLHDVARPERYVEVVEDESWNDHLRRFDRCLSQMSPSETARWLFTPGVSTRGEPLFDGKHSRACTARLTRLPEPSHCLSL
jgi:hypothetical protein